MTAFPILFTSRCQLRQIVRTDQENIFRGLSHPQVIPYYGVHFSTLENTSLQMDWYANMEKPSTGIWWAICDKRKGIFMGAGGLNNLDKMHQKAEIGFWLLPEYWNNGFMQEVMPVICQYGFEKMGIHRIEGFVETENHLCKKAMSKLPFLHEGTMRDCEMKHGKWISLDIYALLNEN